MKVFLGIMYFYDQAKVTDTWDRFLCYWPDASFYLFSFIFLIFHIVLFFFESHGEGEEYIMRKGDSGGKVCTQWLYTRGRKVDVFLRKGERGEV